MSDLGHSQIIIIDGLRSICVENVYGWFEIASVLYTVYYHVWYCSVVLQEVVLADLVFWFHLFCIYME